MIELQDGSLKFELASRDGGQPIPGSVDLLMLSLACNEVVQQHGLQTTTNDSGVKCLVPTTDFMRDLAAKIESIWEVPEGVRCSVTNAKTLWLESGKAISAVKKNTSDEPN